MLKSAGFFHQQFKPALRESVDHHFSLWCPSVSSLQALTSCPCKTCDCFSIPKCWNWPVGPPHRNHLPPLALFWPQLRGVLPILFYDLAKFLKSVSQGERCDSDFSYPCASTACAFKKWKNRWCLCLWEEQATCLSRTHSWSWLRVIFQDGKSLPP